ncbi:family 1 glycosylhydrolase [Speluncibacter jeojiensis]|uniref:family 1 glycosylhydrolase n=1 Tax=Speluncibacter jeojiensis TaxID=2710754 RepID=UPI0039F5DB21
MNEAGSYRRPRVVLPTLVAALALCLGVTAPAAASPATALPPLGHDFLWGVASSGFQSEGYAPDSNWTRYIAQGRTEDPYRNSVDFRHRYAADIARAKGLGVKVYRISVEWARIEPRPDVWDEDAFRFYDNVIDDIRASGMRPMITLDHWVYPGWEVDRGGWRNPGMVDDWVINARKVVDRYAGDDPLWVTINEPTAYVGMELRNGGIAPTDAPAMLDRLVAAHDGIYDYIHRVQPRAMVTSNVAYITGAEAAADRLFEDRIASRLDFVGIDYYYGASLTDPLSAVAALTGQPWKATLQPEGIYYALGFYARKFPGKPLYVVENGMPTDNGAPRPDGYTRADNLRDTVYWLQRAKAAGMNLIGYNYWSVTDNYEWGSYRPRFGLYTVDVLTDPTLTRRPTDAVPAYTAITRAGGVPTGYRPTRAPAPCSLVDPPESCLHPVTG